MTTTTDTEYTYNGLQWKPSATVSDENSFFHSAFGVRTDEDGAYFDKQAKFRRMRWVTFLTYFENEAIPRPLENILKKCFSANDKYKLKSIRDNNHYSSYVNDIMTAGEDVTKEEIPVLSTLENIKIVLLLNGGTDPVVIIQPNVEILGNYSHTPEKPKEEVVLCLEGNTFSRLESVSNPKENSADKVKEDPISKKELQQPSSYLLRYEKGGSAGSKGVEFQVKLLTVMLFNSLRKLKNWKLSTENKKAGKFDDAVLEWEDGAILVQAKHKQNAKNISLDELLSTNSKNDDFSLPKYFLSYQEIKREFKGKNTVIICTNASIHEKIWTYLGRQQICRKSMLFCADDDYSFYKFNVNILPQLKENVKIYLEKNCQGKNIDQTIITEENLKDFLENLEFYANYPIGNSTEKDTEKLASIFKYFSSPNTQVSFSDIYAKIMNWFQQKNGIYLTEIVANSYFLEIIRDRHWQRLEQYNVLFQGTGLNFLNKKKLYYISVDDGYLLQELKMYNSLKNNKSKILYTSSDDGIEIQNKAIEAFQLPFYDIFIILWPKTVIEEFVMNEICAKLREILSSYEEKKIILMADRNDKLVRQIGLDKSEYDIISGSLTFEDLSKESQIRLLKKNVYFQGRDVSLQELLESETNKHLINDLGSEILEKLIQGKQVKVGLQVRPLDENAYGYYIDRTFKRKIQEGDDEQREKEQIVSEEKIYDMSEKVVLIAGTAGIGKSTVLTNLAAVVKHKHPHLWVIKIELNDFTGILNQFKETNKNTISVTQLLAFKETTRLSNQLEKVIFSMDRKVVLLIDGVDEISPDYSDLVVKLLVQCQEGRNFAKVFVTTRPHVIGEIKSKLPVKPFTLLPFTQQNQVHFLTCFWAHNLKLDRAGKKKCEQYAKVLLNRTSSWITLYQQGENHFAAIPLQVKMLGEIFQENDEAESTDWTGCEEYLRGNEIMPKLPEKFSITKIYTVFIEKKRNIFKSRENPSGKTAANKALADQFEECLTYHRILALEEILHRSECELFSHYQQGNKTMDSMVLKIGIVHKSEDRFQFVHRTFAEYFVAGSVHRELDRQNQNREFQKFFFDEILMNVKLGVVRAFLDGFLQNTVDCLPSNIFRTYQSLRYNIDLGLCSNLIHQLAREGCVAIIQLLLKCINFETAGHVSNDIKVSTFNYPIHVLQFHVQKSSVAILQLLLKRINFKSVGHVSKNTKVTTFNNAIHVLQFLVQKGCVAILQLLLNRINFKSVGHVSKVTTFNNAIHVLQFLVQKDGINMKNNFGLTPLSCAIQKGHLEMVKFLVEQGANIEEKDHIGHSTLYKAISIGHVEMATYLLDKTMKSHVLHEKYSIIPYTFAYLGQLDGLENLMKRNLNINITVERGEPLIHGAARGGQIDTIKYLIQRGADINSTDHDGNTALRLVAEKPTLASFAKALIELGIDVNFKNFRGNTALHFSTLDMIELLVNSGANVNSKNENGETALCLAVSRGHLEAVKFLIQRGSDINVKNNGGNTLLHLAARSGLDTVKFLVERRMDINVKNNCGYLPLHLAVLGGQLETVGFFVSRGIDINTTDTIGNTPLYLAAWGGQRNMIEHLVHLDGNVNFSCSDGFSPLHVAAQNGKLDIVKSLVELGADIKLRNNVGCTALHLSALNSKWETAKYLMESDTDINIDANDRVIISNLASMTDLKNVIYPCGQGSLHEAAINGKVLIIKLLLGLGVNIDIVDYNGCTPLHLAATGNFNTVKFLVEHGADINIKDNRGCLALHHAVLNFQIEVINFFLGRGVNVYITDKEGNTVLHYAANSGWWDTVELFLKYGMDINVKNNNNRVPIQFAVRKSSRNMIKSFLERGGDVNSRDDDGCTALHLAAASGNLEVVKHLEECGVDISIRDNRGRTALHWAVLDTVEFFIDRGINVNVKDDDGRTALHCAAQEGNLEKVRILMNYNAGLDIKDNDGCTALHLAAAMNHWNVVEFFTNFVFGVNEKDDNGRTVLHLAAWKGQFNIVKDLIERGGDVNIADKDGRTVLHLAVLQDSTDKFGCIGYYSREDKQKAYWSTVKFLVEQGADINCRDSKGDTAAMLAEKCGNHHLLQYLES